MNKASRWFEPDWPTVPGVRALCTQRQGGVSTGPHASFNLGDHVGDTVAAVQANRRQLDKDGHLPAEPQWLRQVHGIAVADLDVHAPLAEADAAVTGAVDRVCVILTADCLPVLIAARDGSVVGAAHAGWRGLAAGVLEATVTSMRQRMRAWQPLQAWLGPAIGPAHFEVGDEVRAAFLEKDPQAATAFVRNAAGRWQCDLCQLARQRLATAGVTDIRGGAYCTYSQPERFYSHRRDVQHQGATTTGRMATLIWRQGG